MAGVHTSGIVTGPTPLVVVVRVVLTTLVYLSVLALTAALLAGLGLLVVGSPTWALSMLGLAIAEGGAFASVLVVWRKVDHRALISLGLRREHAVFLWLRGAAVATLMMTTVALGWFIL